MSVRRVCAAVTATSVLYVAACHDDIHTPDVVDPCTLHPCTAEAVVSQMRDAYAAMDPERFAALLHPDFLFLVQPDPLNPGQPNDWGRSEEVRIHQRMFRPEQFASSSDPIPTELWLDAISIQLTANGPFIEYRDYYPPPTIPGGLDPAYARVWQCDYSDSVLFETEGETDYVVSGQSYFVVIEDRTKAANEAGAFLLYRWQDLGRETSNRSEPRDWSQIKGLYR